MQQTLQWLKTLRDKLQETLQNGELRLTLGNDFNQLFVSLQNSTRDLQLASQCTASRRTKNFTEPQKMFEDRLCEASCFDAVLT